MEDLLPSLELLLLGFLEPSDLLAHDLVEVDGQRFHLVF